MADADKVENNLQREFYAVVISNGQFINSHFKDLEKTCNGNGVINPTLKLIEAWQIAAKQLCQPMRVHNTNHLMHVEMELLLRQYDILKDAIKLCATATDAQNVTLKNNMKRCQR